ncbi:MAG: hypothetical protein V3R51_00675 [Gammaproteobacteria bacterium]
MKIKQLCNLAQCTRIKQCHSRDASISAKRFNIERKVILFGLMLFLGGCTSVGLKHQEHISKLDFGDHRTINMCMYRDTNVTEKRVEQIVDAINEDFRLYDLSISVPWVRQLERAGITYQKIRDQLIDLPIEEGCDRILYLVGRNGFDHLWGAFALPEILGWVDNRTGTRGYVVANHSTSWNQLAFGGVRRTARHEALHLLGCGHASPVKPFMDACYDTIAEAKAKATAGFFPSLSEKGHWYYTREAVNSVVLGNRSNQPKDNYKVDGLNGEEPVRFGRKVELNDVTRTIQTLLTNYSLNYKRGDLENLVDLVTEDVSDNGKLGKSQFEKTYKDLFDRTTTRELVFNIEKIVDVQPHRLHAQGTYYAKLMFHSGNNFSRASPISIWIDTDVDEQKISRLEY